MPSKVLVREEEGAKKPVELWSSDKLFSVLGWVGVVLAVAALMDYALAMFPTHFSSMEWEFGMIAQIFAGLPLLAIALAAIWISGAMAGRRWQLFTVSGLLLAAALVVIVLLVAFALDVAVALKLNRGAGHEQVVKMAVKTVSMGLLFGAAFIITGVQALKQARGTPAGEVGT